MKVREIIAEVAEVHVKPFDRNIAIRILADIHTVDCGALDSYQHITLMVNRASNTLSVLLVDGSILVGLAQFEFVKRQSAMHLKERSAVIWERAYIGKKFMALLYNMINNSFPNIIECDDFHSADGKKLWVESLPKLGCGISVYDSMTDVVSTLSDVSIEEIYYEDYDIDQHRYSLVMDKK